MILEKDLENAKLKLSKFFFGFTKKEDAKITFVLSIVDQPFDDIYINQIISDDNFEWAMGTIRRITGWIGADFSELEKNKQKYIGHEFNATIRFSRSPDGKFTNHNLEFSDSKKFDSKALTKKFQKKLLDYAAKHNDPIGTPKEKSVGDDIDMPF